MASRSARQSRSPSSVTHTLDQSKLSAKATAQCHHSERNAPTTDHTSP